jgi:tRNA (mo5U34)-methyltransferase
MTLDEARDIVASVPHWYHAFEIYPGLRTPGVYDPSFVWDLMALGADLKGSRILDIGPSDGYFSREAHRRGAEVVSVDYRTRHHSGFAAMEKLYGHTLDHRQINIFDLPGAGLGGFDYIFFLGVLYHLPDMMRSFFILRSLARGPVFVETHSENDFCPDIPAARYYVRATLADDPTNFWVPNRLCIHDMLYDAGFDPVREHMINKHRLFVEARVNNDPLRRRKIELAYGRFSSADRSP